MAGAVIFARIHQAPPKRGGRRRKPHEKPTVASVLAVNRRNMVRRIQRLVCANFGPGDGWLSLTFDDAHLPAGYEDAKRLSTNFIRRLQRRHRKRGMELKYIYALCQGRKSGRWHLHIIVNGGVGGLELRRLWGMGDANRKDLYPDGNYTGLAEYMVKPEEREDFAEGAGGREKYRHAYASSLNLVDPPPVRDSVKQAEFDDPAPQPGFYIDKDSVYEGVNPISGRAYKSWVELPLLPEPGAPPERSALPDIERTWLKYKRKRKRSAMPDGARAWLRQELKDRVQVELDIEALFGGESE